ncbi:phBC6A51 family helix-turn-helix protein [Bacillus massiliglaciei]|uniref:phBC6A51 family helix-turn-helix protein n=1 Tax=Bacillus massiliglaciei TaxID=1816693 RepID=UPI0018FE30EB|nr:phBC6A51 family helix-turn-helix protein [Bacillus massiliglaciei]
MTRKKKRSKQPSQVPPLNELHYMSIELKIRPYYDEKYGRKRWLTRQEIADMIGVSRMTLYRWEQRKDYQKEHEKRLRKSLASRRGKDTYIKRALGGDLAATVRIINAHFNG